MVDDDEEVVAPNPFYEQQKKLILAPLAPSNGAPFVTRRGSESLTSKVLFWILTAKALLLSLSPRMEGELMPEGLSPWAPLRGLR